MSDRGFAKGSLQLLLGIHLARARLQRYPSASELARECGLTHRSETQHRMRALQRAGLVKLDERGHLLWAYGEQPLPDRGYERLATQRMRPGVLKEIDQIIAEAVASMEAPDPGIDATLIAKMPKIDAAISAEGQVALDEFKAKDPRYARDKARGQKLRAILLDMETQHGCMAVMNWARRQANVLSPTINMPRGRRARRGTT